MIIIEKLLFISSRGQKKRRVRTGDFQRCKFGQGYGKSVSVLVSKRLTGTSHFTVAVIISEVAVLFSPEKVL